MKKVRLLCRSAHTYGYHKNKVGFDKHNFRLDKLKPEDRNYNSKLSHNNIIYRQGKAIEHTALPELISLIEQDQQNKLKQIKGGLSDRYVGALNLARSKSKAKLRKWAENASNPLERDFFRNLLSLVGAEKIHAKSALKTLSGLGKIKRYNDKKRAIEKLEECNQLLSVSDNGAMSLKVISSEKIFKIPDKHKVTISAQDWHRIINQLHQQFYSNYDAYYTAIHLDEKQENPHAHHRLSGYNNSTGQFDLPDHELNLVRKLYKKPDLFNGKKWSQLAPDEVERFGQLYQNIIFKYCNTQLQKLGYEIEAIKRSPEEVEQDAHEYSSKKIRHRAYNGVKQLDDNKLQLIKAVSTLSNQKKQWQKRANEERHTAAQWNKKTKQQKALFKQTKHKINQWFEEKFEQWFNGLVKFKKSNLEQDLVEPVSLHLTLIQEREEANKLLMDEIEKSLNIEQSKKYKQIFRIKKGNNFRYKSK